LVVSKPKSVGGGGASSSLLLLIVIAPCFEGTDFTSPLLSNSAPMTSI
jgi:hypothetical protein